MRSPVIAIVKQELNQRRLYMMWWSLGIVALIALTVLAYGSVKDQADQLNKAFGSLSSSISSFVGTSDMFTPVGYLNSQLYYITLPILFIILSVTLTGSLISKEEGRHTMELLLARPISRSRLLLAKALAGTAIMTVLGAVTTFATVICCTVVGMDISNSHIVATTFWMIAFSGAFGALAFMLYAASIRTRRIAVAVAILLSFGGYILSSIAGLVHGLAWAAKLFPYHYYDPGAMLRGEFSGGFMLYITILYVVSLAVALFGFRRRDIE